MNFKSCGSLKRFRKDGTFKPGGCGCGGRCGGKCGGGGGGRPGPASVPQGSGGGSLGAMGVGGLPVKVEPRPPRGGVGGGKSEQRGCCRCSPTTGRNSGGRGTTTTPIGRGGATTPGWRPSTPKTPTTPRGTPSTPGGGGCSSPCMTNGDCVTDPRTYCYKGCCIPRPSEPMSHNTLGGSDILDLTRSECMARAGCWWDDVRCPSQKKSKCCCCAQSLKFGTANKKVNAAGCEITVYWDLDFDYVGKNPPPRECKFEAEETPMNFKVPKPPPGGRRGFEADSVFNKTWMVMVRTPGGGVGVYRDWFLGIKGKTYHPGDFGIPGLQQNLWVASEGIE